MQQKITRRQIALIITLTISLIACENKKTDGEISAETEVSIAKKCLEQLEKNWLKDYVVSPRFQTFEFQSFIREKTKGYPYDINKPEILDSLNWTNEEFIKIQRNVNQKYLSKTNLGLLKLSKSDISNNVIIFSGFHKNIVFVNIVDYCNAVKVSDLSSSSFNKNQRFPSAICYIFLVKDGNVQILKDSHVVKEYQCDSTDVRVDENGKAIIQEE